jgi:iron(III) transport system ATP-binding protein
LASVELRSLTKRYGSHVAVDDVSLTIEHGRLVCLLGPSGCGKTTTLRLIAGFAEPSAGEIRVGERIVSSASRTVPPEQRAMSMIFQSYALWPHMTIAENVAYGLTVRGTGKDETRRRVDKILAVTQMAQFAARYPTELSGGQQQRVALARALVVQPETLLLDEPLSNLDANLREEMRFEVRRLHDEYRYTTVYVTHDQSEAMTTADVIAVMNAGKVEQAGSPEDIYERPRSEFVARFIGGSNVVKGKVCDDGRVECAGSMLRCNGRGAGTGSDVAVSIRPHVIRLWVSAPEKMENVVAATVVRQVFLGASRDYMVAAADDTQLRVVAPTVENIPEGAPVWLYMPPDGCRLLSG